ncbi:dockerin type I domain-containing protein [uncultured Ruminococcus sp.]|uniref:dockerin type I domain-containing protein n=1 Tax=uncultured Ruminococcus sp. TaxID=165186 RepID=UPI0037DD69D8
MACVCVVGSIASLSASATALRGDVNGDGTINLSDAVALNKFLVGKLTVTNLSNVLKG